MKFLDPWCSATPVSYTHLKSQALNWLEGLRDWNISRQNWFGIAMPIYYNATGDNSLPEYIIGYSDAEAELVYGKNGFEKETDTFDTWFSSSQWPFATLQSTGDFDEFYPTSLMATTVSYTHQDVYKRQIQAHQLALL